MYPQRLLCLPMYLPKLLCPMYAHPPLTSENRTPEVSPCRNQPLLHQKRETAVSPETRNGRPHLAGAGPCVVLVPMAASASHRWGREHSLRRCSCDGDGLGALGVLMWEPPPVSETASHQAPLCNPAMHPSQSKIIELPTHIDHTTHTLTQTDHSIRAVLSGRNMRCAYLGGKIQNK